MLGLLAQSATTDPFTALIATGGQAGITLGILWWFTQRLVPRLLDDAKGDRIAFTEALCALRRVLEQQSDAISQLTDAVRPAAKAPTAGQRDKDGSKAA